MPFQRSPIRPISTPGCAELAESDDGGREDQPQKGSGNEPLPAQLHQLVVAEAGQRGSDPEEDEDEDVRLQQEPRSEEHTSELQSRENLVCRLLLEKKKLLN